jgi:hypothetical protein
VDRGWDRVPMWSGTGRSLSGVRGFFFILYPMVVSISMSWGSEEPAERALYIHMYINIYMYI